MIGSLVPNRADALIVLAQGGDKAAILSLLAATQPDIRRYARLNCRLDDVDDAVQQVLWAMSQRISTLRTVSAFAGWIYAIVKRECVRLARKGLRGWRSLKEIEDSSVFASRPDLELRYDLSMAIQSLPDHYRTLVLKRDVEERSIGELAESENLTREAVKARLRHARLLIREYLLD